MEIYFEDEYLADLYEGKAKGKPKYQSTLIKAYIKTISKLRASVSLEDIKQFRSLNFEKLINTDLYSVRVNDKYRIEFKIEKKEIVILGIIRLSNHYER